MITRWPGKKAAASEPVVVKPVETIVAKKVAAKKVAKKAVAKKVAVKPVEKPDPEVAWMERVLKDFKEHPKARPITWTSLINKVGSMINKPAGGPEVLAVIARMEKAGKMKFGDNDVPEYLLE